MRNLLKFTTMLVMAFIVPMMFIALIISFTGFRGPIQMDDTFMSFLRRVSYEAHSWNIEIPDIPKIPPMNQYGFGWDILNFLITVVNGISTGLNVIILLFNKAIEMITFLVALFKIMYDFRNVDWSSGPLVWWVQ